MLQRHLLAFIAAHLLMWPMASSAQSGASDPVLAETDKVKLYRSEYDAELQKLPPDIRGGFGNNPRRVGDLITRLLVQKALAGQARETKVVETPENATRYRLETDRLLAQFRVAAVEEQAGREFDAKLSQYQARARELYLADRKKFETPEQVSASHILFDIKKHSKDEGLKLANDVRDKARAGADFNKLALELSEDSSARRNSGHLDFFGRAEMDPAFADAAFALKKPGDISEPVLSQFGWHVIKLEDRRPAGVRPFEEVRDGIVSELRKKFVDERREAVIVAIRTDPTMKVNQAAVDALVVPAPDTDAAKQMMENASKGAPSK